GDLVLRLAQPALGLDRAALRLLGLAPGPLHLAPGGRRVPLRRLPLGRDGGDLRGDLVLDLADLALAGGERVADEVGHLPEPLDHVPRLGLGLLQLGAHQLTGTGVLTRLTGLHRLSGLTGLLLSVLALTGLAGLA